MCDGNPMCEYKEMIAVGLDQQPYIVWPQQLISLVIDGIKHKKNLDINVVLRDGSMKIEKHDKTFP